MDLAALFADIDNHKEEYENAQLGNFHERFNLISTDWYPEVAPSGGVELFGHQRAAIETIVDKGFRRVFIGFPPGLGKTVTALTVVANLGKRAVISIPPSILIEWTSQIERFFPQLSYQIVDTKTRRVGWKLDDDGEFARNEQGNKIPIMRSFLPDLDPEIDVTIFKDSMWNYMPEVQELAPEILVVDEIQRFGNDTQRTAYMLELADQVLSGDGYSIGLSGTLAVNSAMEVYNPSQIVGVTDKIVGSYSKRAWIDAFCETAIIGVEKKVKGEDGTISKQPIRMPIVTATINPDLLYDKLIRSCYIRVNREDAVDMPDKLVVKRTFEMDDEHAREYEWISEDYEGWLNHQFAGDPDKIFSAMSAEALTQRQYKYQIAGLGKVPSIAEYVNDLVAQEEQVVLMATNVEVVHALQEAIDSSVIYNGEMNDAAKRVSYDLFKTGKRRVFIGNIEAAGVGLNLENAANLVFAQLPLSAGKFIQASDRVYRVTQKRNCTIHVALSQGTIDMDIYTLLDKKLLITNIINEGKAVTWNADEFSMDDDFLSEL